MKKINVALVMGGYSDEYASSIQSAKVIFDNIDKTKYEVYKIVLSREEWVLLYQDKKFFVNRSDFSVEIEGKKMIFDVCFNILLGNPGGNGEIQTLWDKAGLRYTGCNPQLSALIFNKRKTLEYLEKFGVPSAKRLSFTKNQQINIDEIVNELGLPVIVKPNESGQSIGISKVERKEEFEKAFTFAFSEGDEVLVETFLNGTEVTVGVNRHDGIPKVYGITEIVSQNSFFDYDAKVNGNAKYILPARLDPEMAKQIEEIAILAYNALKMTTISRSEFIIMNGVPYLLEMNTSPGMKGLSLLPSQIKYAGMTIAEYCSNELEKALKRSNILKERN